MANPLRGEVDIVNRFTSEKHTLRITLNARVEMKQLLGMDVDTYFSKVRAQEKVFDDEALRIFLYCGLKACNPKITIEKAGEIATDAGMKETADVLFHAFKLQNPELPEEEKKSDTLPHLQV